MPPAKKYFDSFGELLTGFLVLSGLVIFFARQVRCLSELGLRAVPSCSKASSPLQCDLSRA